MFSPQVRFTVVVTWTADFWTKLNLNIANSSVRLSQLSSSNTDVIVTQAVAWLECGDIIQLWGSGTPGNQFKQPQCQANRLLQA